MRGRSAEVPGCLPVPPPEPRRPVNSLPREVRVRRKRPGAVPGPAVSLDLEAP